MKKNPNKPKTADTKTLLHCVPKLLYSNILYGAFHFSQKRLNSNNIVTLGICNPCHEIFNLVMK